DHEVRIFRLAPLPPDAMARGVEAFSPTEVPRWPLWVPWVRTVPSDQAREAADRRIKDILSQAGPAELVVAWSGSGDRVLTARKVPSRDLTEAPDWFAAEDLSRRRDWFALLGLVRRKGEESHARSGCGPSRQSERSET